MDTEAKTKKVIKGFSLAFQRICNVVAIRNMGMGDEVKRQLVMQVVNLFPGEVSDETGLGQRTGVLGLSLPPDELRDLLIGLEKDELVTRDHAGFYGISEPVRAELQRKNKDAVDLQNQVKSEWLEALSRSHPLLDQDAIWEALQSYLQAAFCRHGVQTIALLDPNTCVTDEQSESLRSILRGAVARAFPAAQRQDAQGAIVGFLASVGDYPSRSRYIAQLADAAFSYFAMFLPGDVAQRFREQLRPLTLFLDTNFLFGILGLHNNPLVEVSKELLDTIRNAGLPFTLRYLPETLAEFQHRVNATKQTIRGRHYPAAVSRAAVNSPNVSGIEQQYHRANAERPTDVDDFFRRYLHPDELLHDLGLDAQVDTSHEVDAAALSEYESYLEERNVDKHPELIKHDVLLLETVSGMRSTSKSTLDAEALIITCDYRLCRYDWGRKGSYASCVLPNQFLQIVRQFIPSSDDFDRSFAESFAIPEFRTLHSGASRACTKVLSVLATYDGVTEELATAMLANDVLLEKLRTTSEEVEIIGEVDNAIVAENERLAGEAARMSALLQDAKRSIDAKKSELVSAENKARTAQEEGARKAADASTKAGVEKAELANQLEQNKKNELRAKAMVHRLSIALATIVVAFALFATMTALHGTLRRGAIAVVISSAFAMACEFYLKIWSWDWLEKHSNTYAIRTLAYLATGCVFLGVLVTPWRNTTWGATGLWAVVLLMVSLIGGKHK